jgi:hypothetical protein
MSESFFCPNGCHLVSFFRIYINDVMFSLSEMCMVDVGSTMRGWNTALINLWHMSITRHKRSNSGNK